MKTVMLFLALLLPAVLLHADEDSTIVEQAFIHAQGKTDLYVLQLKGGNHYDYSRYNKKKTFHDWGTYKISHGKITFVSKNRKRGFNSVGGKTYFFSKKGIYKTRMDRLFNKKSVLDYTDDAKYHQDWSFNFMAGKSLEIDKSKPKAVILTAEQRKAMNGAAAKRYYLNLTSAYASPYKGMLEEAYTGPDTYRTIVGDTYVEWNMDTTGNALFGDFETVIHESTHTFNNIGGQGYLIEPGIRIPVTTSTVFHSSEFSNIAPADASTRIFRYNTYVSDSSIVSANVSGIYGLLDEFSAYNSGCRAATIAAQSALAKGDTATAAKFVSQASGTYFAYYEFNLFIAWYLHEAKVYHPEQYKEMMDNTNLRVAYTLIDSEFAGTIDNFKRTSAIIEKQSGLDAYAYNDKTYAKYPKELLVKQKPYLDNFRVKGVTTSNYFTFIKG